MFWVVWFWYQSSPFGILRPIVCQRFRLVETTRVPTLIITIQSVFPKKGVHKLKIASTLKAAAVVVLVHICCTAHPPLLLSSSSTSAVLHIHHCCCRPRPHLLYCTSTNVVVVLVLICCTAHPPLLLSSSTSAVLFFVCITGFVLQVNLHSFFKKKYKCIIEDGSKGQHIRIHFEKIL